MTLQKRGVKMHTNFWTPYTGVELFIGAKVQSMFGFEICTQEGRGEKREGGQISKQEGNSLCDLQGSCFLNKKKIL